MVGDHATVTRTLVAVSSASPPLANGTTTRLGLRGEQAGAACELLELRVRVSVCHALLRLLEPWRRNFETLMLVIIGGSFAVLVELTVRTIDRHRHDPDPVAPLNA